MGDYNKLYTPEDSVIVFIDHQPQMTFGVASIDRATLINNVTLLSRVAKEFKVPTVLTAVRRNRSAATSGRNARRVSRAASRRANVDELHLLQPGQTLVQLDAP